MVEQIGLRKNMELNKIRIAKSYSFFMISLFIVEKLNRHEQRATASLCSVKSKSTQTIDNLCKKGYNE